MWSIMVLVFKASNTKKKITTGLSPHIIDLHEKQNTICWVPKYFLMYLTLRHPHLSSLWSLRLFLLQSTWSTERFVFDFIGSGPHFPKLASSRKHNNKRTNRYYLSSGVLPSYLQFPSIPLLPSYLQFFTGSYPPYSFLSASCTYLFFGLRKQR